MSAARSSYNHSPAPGCRRPPAWCLLLAVLTLAQAATLADSLWPEEEQRLRVGLKLFPAVLGAIENLARAHGRDGRLRVAVGYLRPDASVRETERALASIGEVQGLRLEVSAVPLAELLAESESPPAAVFIASVGVPTASLRQLAEDQGRLVFSPFTGDVTRGAVAGVHVTDRILPAVNLAQAERAGVRFKAFFLRVAHHED